MRSNGRGAELGSGRDHRCGTAREERLADNFGDKSGVDSDLWTS